MFNDLITFALGKRNKRNGSYYLNYFSVYMILFPRVLFSGLPRWFGHKRLVCTHPFQHYLRLLTRQQHYGAEKRILNLKISLFYF